MPMMKSGASNENDAAEIDFGFGSLNEGRVKGGNQRGDQTPFRALMNVDFDIGCRWQSQVHVPMGKLRSM